jgi:RHS repeat-associated protein
VAVTYDEVGPADDGGDFRRVSVHDGSQVVWSERGGNREDMVGPASTQTMLWGPGTDEVLVIQERMVGSNTIREPVWTLADHQGTVKDYLVKPPTTGAKSTLLLTRRYSTFGTPFGSQQWNVPTQSTSPTAVWQFTDFSGAIGFLYVGQEYDATTGLLLSRGRYYDPVSSEFISQDPLGFAGGDTNLYRRDRNEGISARPRDRYWTEWAWESGAAAASTIGNTLKLAVDPRTQLSVGYELFLKDSATVWGNTAGMSTASRLGITAGFFVGDLTGLRGVDDFFHTHDAADAHVQSPGEQWFDGVFGAIGVFGTVVGAGAAAKTVQTLGVKGTVAAGAAYARATVARVGTGARGIVDDVLRVGKNAIAPTSPVSVPRSAPAAGIGRSNWTVSQFRDAVFDRYQQFYDMAYARVQARVAAGKMAGDALTVGQRTDGIARAALRSWLKSEQIVEGAGGVIQVNRYLRNPAGGTWRVPDIRIPGANIIFDGTIGKKTPGMAQIIDFRAFSGGNNVMIVRPTQLGGSYGLVFP